MPQPPLYILGINAFHADSSAALLKDGILHSAIEEERFTRIKHWAGFPSNAVKFCLQDARISPSEISHIAIGRDPKAKLGRKFVYQLLHPSSLTAGVSRFANSKLVSSIQEEFCKLDPGFDSNVIKYHNIEHHRAHLASAFFASPFEDAAILSIDGSGDFTTTMIARGEGSKIKVIDSLDFPVSCGLLYTTFTQFLGFPHYGDEYKVMGLAPYGEPRHVEQIRKLIRFKSNGLYSWDSSYFIEPARAGLKYEKNVPVVGDLFSRKFIKEFGSPRRNENEITQYHKDLAASIQRVTEEIIFHILRFLKKTTGLDSVCIAGGVAQNSVANGKIRKETGFKNVYIPSAGHDAGLSMGSAMYVYHQVLNEPRVSPVWSAYTGSHFTNDQIEQLLKQEGVPYEKLDDEALFERVVQKLIEPGVVGWFQGRAEFGPRALGGRSILADPRNAAAKDLLNLKIKRRESFRPFAPSILKEFAHEYFIDPDEVPFMEKVYPIRPEKRSLIPAVTHVDGTGRLQTVDAAVAPRYYKLIHKFFQKTGVPILLNTSFNENEPIVNRPEEALACFQRTRMDMLVLENCVVTR